MMLDYIRNNHWTSRLCKSTRGTAIGLADDGTVQEEQSLDPVDYVRVQEEQPLV